MQYYDNILIFVPNKITMGASRLDLYTDEITEIANVAKVFAHPARVAILKYISEQDACICNDIVEEVGLAQATISQHLSVINKAGLLKGTYEGKSKCYCIDMDRLKHFHELLDAFLITTKTNCC